MPTYTVQFFTDAEFALLEVHAKNPQAALKKAKKIESSEGERLNFRSYDGVHDVTDILVELDGAEVCRWQSHDLRLRLAAPNLLKAACGVIDHWESGDLAGAVRALDEVIEISKLR